MSSELIELVEFLHSPHPNVRQIALENLVRYSKGIHSHIFKTNDYEPVKDLKKLVKDQRSSNVVQQSLTILINLCDDNTVLESLSSDESFIEYVSNSILDLSHPHTDLFCMLLANLAKRDTITQIFKFKRRALNSKLVPLDPTPAEKEASKSAKPLTLSDEEIAQFEKSRNNREAAATKVFGPPGYRDTIDCLLDCFVKGHDRSLNKFADFDYLAYFFSDISRFTQGRNHFLTPRIEKPEYSPKEQGPLLTGEEIYPITKLLVFTESPSKIRRDGVASTIKNCLFDIKSHKTLVHNPEINILPYILLPLAGSEDIPDDEVFSLPDELQFLPSTKKRESEFHIIVTYVECLLLLSSTKEIRQYLRDKSVYSIIRLLHLHVTNEEVQESCDRLVQILMRDDAHDIEDPNEVLQHKSSIDNDNEDDDEDEIIEII